VEASKIGFGDDEIDQKPWDIAILGFMLNLGGV